jgi:Tol biopolymer transport system component
MASPRFQRIEELFHAAAELSPDGQGAFLAEACGGDSELRREIESLLNDRESGVLEHAPVLARLTVGATVGPYRVVSRIGAGGMGEVWKAFDARLNRDVAIKTALGGFGARFRREAQAIAALNHPNICTLFDVGPDYLVMEYVEGEDLKGPVPLDRALDIAGQIAAALEAAHERGIVHRDLKPGNIKIKPDGSVKVLDFGLAKSAVESAEVTPDSPTMLSGTGMILACLEKDPKKRLRDIGDWARSLEEAPGAAPTGWLAWVAAGILALGLGALSIVHFREKPAQMPVVRAMIVPPENATFSPEQGVSAFPAVSPDGQRIAFAAHTREGKTQLWLRPLDSVSAQPLAGTDDASLPFWSPDGKSIGFFAKGKLNRIDANGGPVLALADATSNARGGSWSSEGVIVFTPSISGVLRKVSAAGGAATDAGTLNRGEPTQRWPWFLPDGKHFLFAAGIGGAGPVAIRAGSLDSTDSTKLLEADSDAIYSAGYLLFVRGDTLTAQPFDPTSLRLSGEALPVVEHVQRGPISTLGAFSASVSGLLAYAAGSAEFELAWFDRKGNHIGSLGEPAQFNLLNFSPDRSSLAVSITTGSNMDIWLYDVARGLRRRFTFDPATELNAVWSPAGRTIVFDSSRKGHIDIYRKSFNGSGAEETLYMDNLEKFPTSISPDGKFLLYRATGDPKTGYDLWILPEPLGSPGTAKPYPFLRTEFNELEGQFSPDGHWIAYESDESSRYEIYVVLFPGLGGKRQISTSGGRFARWRADGREIFYMAPDQRLTSAEVTIRGDQIEIGEVNPLFGLPLSGHRYDVSADGQRILAITPRQSASDTLTIVQNWPAGLKK